MGATRDRWAGISGEGARRVVGALFDTNILIDHLNAVPQARDEIARFESRAMSIHNLDGGHGGRARRSRRAHPALSWGGRVIALDNEIAGQCGRIASCTPHQTARCRDLGHRPDIGPALRDAQYQGFSARRSRGVRALYALGCLLRPPHKACSPSPLRCRPERQRGGWAILHATGRNAAFPMGPSCSTTGSCASNRSPARSLRGARSRSWGDPALGT